MIHTLILHRSPPAEARGPGFAEIWPRDVKWNDFGLNYRVSIRVHAENQELPFQCNAFLIPTSTQDLIAGRSAQTFLEATDSLGRGEQRSLIDHPVSDFFLLLGSATNYGRLATYLKDRRTLDHFLRAVQDLVVTQESERDKIEILRRTESFALGILRDANAYKAFFRGNRYLDAAPPRKNADALSSFNFDITLDGFTGPPHFLRIEADTSDENAERAHCLIGANGSGKTRLLSGLASFLRSVIYSPEPISSDLGHTHYQGHSFERILAFSFDGSEAYSASESSDRHTGVEYLSFDLGNRTAHRNNVWKRP